MILAGARCEADEDEQIDTLVDASALCSQEPTLDREAARALLSDIREVRLSGSDVARAFAEVEREIGDIDLAGVGVGGNGRTWSIHRRRQDPARVPETADEDSGDDRDSPVVEACPCECDSECPADCPTDIPCGMCDGTCDSHCPACDGVCEVPDCCECPNCDCDCVPCDLHCDDCCECPNCDCDCVPCDAHCDTHCDTY